MSHKLNLALSKTIKATEIKCTISTITSVGVFFKYSTKRQRKFEEAIENHNNSVRNKDDLIHKYKVKVKTMCQTR